MKTTKVLLLISACVLLLFTCENKYNNSNYNEQTQGHNYAPAPNNNINDIQPSSQSSEDVQDMVIRDIWQKPGIVISKLGDLRDKVVADIGAGPYGFFTFQIANKSEVKKIIAIDIDKDAVQRIETTKIILSEQVRNRIETRLVEAHDPNLSDGEADIVLIVNTYTYFEDPLTYLKNIKKGISEDGKLVIIDFKKRNTPVGPPLNYRTAIGKVEQDLMKAGYASIESDDQTLEYQYIIIAQPRLEN